MITIVDYDAGNPSSICNMLRKIGVSSVISDNSAEIGAASKLILPGVGAFDTGMAKIAERGLLEVLNHKVLEQKVPMLGICLGAQLMCRGSEEGDRPGLGWIDADVVAFDRSQMSARDKIPFIGWSNVELPSKSRIFDAEEEEHRYYFVHSYHIQCANAGDVIATARNGYDFTAAVERGNLIGVQFHPEKSHRFGMALLRNFVERY